MKAHVRFLLLVAALMALAGAPTDSAYAGKPGGGTTATPIRYQVHYFAPPAGATNFNRIWAMNQSAAMVGDCYAVNDPASWSGFLFDPVVDSQQAFNLNDLVHVPAGWWIRYAYGINDRGAIVAAMVKTAAPTPDSVGYEIHGLVIDRREPTVDGKWIPHTIPDVNPAFSFGREINNNGDLVGVFDQGQYHETFQLGAFIFNTGLYRETGPDPQPMVLPINVGWSTVHLNDPAPGKQLQVAGRLFEGIAFRFNVPASLLDAYPEFSAFEPPLVEAVNGFGEFCGRLRVRKSKGTQTVLRPFRFDPDAQSSPTLLGSEAEHAGLLATDVNNSSDVIAYGGSTVGECLFHKSAGTFNLDSLVTGTADEVNLWLNFRSGPIYMTERVDLGSAAVAGFPVLGTTSSSTGAVLVPILP